MINRLLTKTIKGFLRQENIDIEQGKYRIPRYPSNASLRTKLIRDIQK